MCRNWMALNLQCLRECMRTPDWLTGRLTHVKTLVLNFHGCFVSHNNLLCDSMNLEDVQIISSYHWLMKISLPEYSPVRFI